MIGRLMALLGLGLLAMGALALGSDPARAQTAPASNKRQDAAAPTPSSPNCPKATIK